MIAVVGSLNMDLVINADRIPRSGETVMGKSFKQIPGGKGANQADAIAKLGCEVHMIGCVGQDAMGRILKDSLKRDGVNIEGVLEKTDASTGVASIIVDPKGNNVITVAPGANYRLTVEDIDNFSPIITTADLLLLQLETTLETVRESLRIAKSAGKMTILNPAPAAKLDKEILMNTDVLTPNETELELLSEYPTDTLEGIEIAGKKMVDKGVKEVVVTLGHKGCMYINREETKHYPAYKVRAIDTTAAGDSFNAALAASLSKDQTMDAAIAFAMKVGAMTVTKEGAQTSLPLLREVDQFEDWFNGQNTM
ncbi:ribokinase [Irregularibacter muris]|uniref:Ribokinase n=1 Tax=Irregularibacter muris TaxID=1796619 RepID=A0AAE3KZ93_9FIRM|nr:ribokinase [Irregularibacter muris]MCR1898351.1 ribokinase [Irregularibacter muris]